MNSVIRLQEINTYTWTAKFQMNNMHKHMLNDLYCVQWAAEALLSLSDRLDILWTQTQCLEQYANNSLDASSTTFKQFQSGQHVS